MRSLLQKIVYCLGLSLLTGSCGAPQPAALYGATDTFPGIQSLEPNADGTWTLTWPVATGTNVKYLIFRAPEDTPIDYGNMWTALTTATTKITEILTFEKRMCYAVRISTDLVAMDQNTRTLCTRQVAYQWEGIKTVTRGEGCKTRLEWDNAPVANPKYFIFRLDEAAGETTFSSPLTIVSTNTFDDDVPPRGARYVYKVGFLDPAHDAGVQMEMPNEAKVDFDGIHKVAFTSEPDALKVSWVESATTDILEYIVYDGAVPQTVLGRFPKAGRPGEVQEVVIQPVNPDQVYTFTVKAADGCGRVDENLVQISVTAGSTDQVVDDNGQPTVGDSGATALTH